MLSAKPVMETKKTLQNWPLVFMYASINIEYSKVYHIVRHFCMAEIFEHKNHYVVHHQLQGWAR